MPPKAMSSPGSNLTSDKQAIRKVVGSKFDTMNTRFFTIHNKVKKIQASDELMAQITELNSMLSKAQIAQKIPVHQQSVEQYQLIKEELEVLSPRFYELCKDIEAAIASSVAAPQSALKYVGSSVLVEAGASAAATEAIEDRGYEAGSQYVPVYHAQVGASAAREAMVLEAATVSHAHVGATAASEDPGDQSGSQYAAVSHAYVVASARAEKGSTSTEDGYVSVTPIPGPALSPIKYSEVSYVHVPHPRSETTSKPSASWEEAMKILNEALVSSHLSEALASPNTQDVGVIFEALMAAHEKAAALMGEQGQDS